MAANSPDTSSNTDQKRNNRILRAILAFCVVVCAVIAIFLVFSGSQGLKTALSSITTIMGIVFIIIDWTKKVIIEELKVLEQSLHKRVELLFRVVDASWKRISHIPSERRIQFGAILFILACVVFCSTEFYQSSVASNAFAASQIAMATAIATHYPFSNHEVLNDSLTNDSQQSKQHWDIQHCLFADRGYVDEALGTGFNPCFVSDTDFTNFTYEATMIITTGDCGGLLFRGSVEHSTFYLFGLCQTGYYYVRLYGAKYGKSGRLLIGSPPSNTSPSGFAIGLNFPVSFGVVARGKSISLYVDGIPIAHFSDNTYSHGQIGVAAIPQNGQTQVIFSNAKVWTL